MVRYLFLIEKHIPEMNRGGVIGIGEHSSAVDVVAASASSSDGGRADLAVVLQLLLRPTCKVQERGTMRQGCKVKKFRKPDQGANLASLG